MFKRLSDQLVSPDQVLPNTSFTGCKSENNAARPHGLYIGLSGRRRSNVDQARGASRSL